MKQLTNMAIECADSALSDKIRETLNAWDKENPLKVKPVDRETRLRMAMKDENWRESMIRRILRGHDIRTCDEQLEQDCEAVAAAVKKSLLVDAGRNKAREVLQIALQDKQRKIMQDAKLGLMTPVELRDAIEKF